VAAAVAVTEPAIGAVAEPAIGAVAGLRQVAVKKSEQDFEDKLRRLDANRS
jgi:hypothetical protein